MLVRIAIVTAVAAAVALLWLGHLVAAACVALAAVGLLVAGAVVGASHARRHAESVRRVR